jgi:exonuclease SbcC
MRLHTLRLEGVGPFADPQEIDFDRLGAGGLFLFEGPTGVGKTTIIDALTFALYGGLASDAGDTARMRSDFVDPEVRPQVELEFSVRGERHRITRSPEYLRPKRRGTGMTREKSSVHLQRLDGDAWVSRSHGKDEVGTLVGELVGLNREQFRQVVLLPQGEFATFLRADDDQRREVLAKLFGTHFFRRITDDLQARAQGAARALQVAESEVAVRVAATLEAAGCDAGERDEIADRPRTEVLAALAALEQGLAAQAESAALCAISAARGEERARADQAAAEELIARLERRGRLLSALAGAQQEAAEQQERRSRVDGARRAAPVRSLVVVADRAGRAVADLRDSVIARGSEDPRHLDGQGGAELTESAREVRRVMDGLSPLAALEAALGERQERAAADCELLKALQVQLAATTTRVEQIPAEISAARAALEAARQEAAGVAGVHAELELVTAQAIAAGRAEQLAEQLVGLRATLRGARRCLNEASDTHDLLLQQRLVEVRGELAARLVSGDPCLVCGSPEHPAPAQRHGEGVSEEQVRAASARRDEAHMVKDAAEAAVIRAEAELEHVRAGSAGGSSEECRDLLLALEAKRAAGSAAEARIADGQARVSDLVEEQNTLAQRHVTMAAKVASAEAEAKHQQEMLAGDVARIHEARDGHASVSSRVAALTEQAEQLTSLARAVESLAAGIEAYDKALSAAAEEARAAGFIDLAEARGAILSHEALAELQRMVDDWEARVQGAREQLEEPEMADLVDADPELAEKSADAARAALSAAVAETSSARERAGVAVRQLDRFTERLREVRAAVDARDALAAESEALVSLDQYARGMAGSPRMSLVTFVLRYWFEQVVAAANVRLASMSSGKYELLRVDEAARRDARVGLGLAVLDRHTGRERSPGTLSGGETFYTSLALALGLADVVIAQAGGAQLDTLFIDEGFGSLDPDTLDDVMAVIDDLRGHGRVVGIVSHVPELKERIAERLSVRRVRPDGPSRVEVHA